MKYLAQNAAKVYVQKRFKEKFTANTNKRQGSDQEQYKLDNPTCWRIILTWRERKETGGGKSLGSRVLRAPKHSQQSPRVDSFPFISLVAHLLCGDEREGSSTYKPQLGKKGYLHICNWASLQSIVYWLLEGFGENTESAGKQKAYWSLFKSEHRIWQCMVRVRDGSKELSLHIFRSPRLPSSF